ncbi:MAG: DMT family transporter [Deltaproteobacteria bacterium]|nr:DMT family transporter [Deltaproteobacteria bacterium]
MTHSSRFETHAILIAAQVCFGSLPVVGRLALARLPPAGIVMVRVAGGAIVFTIVALALGVRWPTRRQIPRLLSCALLGVVINQEMFVGGLARSTATNATVLGTTIPVFTLLAAVLLGGERVRPVRLTGVVIALIGALVLVGVEGASADREHLIGNLMILVNSVSYGLFLVLVRPLSSAVPAFALTAILFSFAAPMVTPLGWFAWQDAPALVMRDYVHLAFLVAVPTVGAYALTQMALARAESSLVASYIYLQPVVAAAGAAALLGERPGPRVLLAAALIFAGVYLSSRASDAARPKAG